MENITQNRQIQGLNLYKSGEVWAFDDPAFGLVREIFVPSATAMISAARKAVIAGREPKEIQVLFSPRDFPGCNARFKKVSKPAGHWYAWEKLQGWLCPNLELYLGANPPDVIFVQFVN